MHLSYHIYTGYSADTASFPCTVTAAEGMYDYISQETTELYLFLVKCSYRIWCWNIKRPQNIPWWERYRMERNVIRYWWLKWIWFFCTVPHQFTGTRSIVHFVAFFERSNKQRNSLIHPKPWVSKLLVRLYHIQWGGIVFGCIYVGCSESNASCLFPRKVQQMPRAQ